MGKAPIQHQQKVLDVVRRKYGGTEGLHIAADGAFDSRGYSGLIGKVVMVDLETSLILHTEVLHRSETNGSSFQKEVQGLRRLLRWLSRDGWSISSITTIRNRSFATLLDEMKHEIGSVPHFWDGWHLVKWFGNNLRKEAKNKGCIPLSVWYQKLKTHMWTNIEVGEGERIRQIFNTCLKHVQDVHAWPKDQITGKFTRCGHPPLEGQCQLLCDVYRTILKWLLSLAEPDKIRMVAGFDNSEINKEVLEACKCMILSDEQLRGVMATLHDAMEKGLKKGCREWY
ncbi:hypothetical protein Aduo_011667 [Ancylostoma duodenale]